MAPPTTIKLFYFSNILEVSLKVKFGLMSRKSKNREKLHFYLV